MASRGVRHGAASWTAGRFTIHLDPRSWGRRFPDACTPGAVLRPAGNAYHRRDERLPASSAAVGDQLRALQRLLALCRPGFLVVRGCALPGWDGTSPGLAAHSKARSRPGSTPPFVLLVRAGAPQLPLAQCPSSWLSPRMFHFLSKASLLGPAFSLSLAHCTL
jgi:hypothetical protein